MPSVSVWINPKIYKYLEELAKFFNKKPNRLIKEIIEDKVMIEKIENYYSVVRELYKWYYYEGNNLSNEIFIRRILKKRNIESILSIISFHDDIKSVLKTLGILMLIVSLIVFFIIAATGAKRELNLVLVIGAVGLSVLRTLKRKLISKKPKGLNETRAILGRNEN